MKKLAIGVIAIGALIATPVLAADLNKPVYKKAPPPPPPAPVYTWTGWYVGGNVGYSWGDAHTDVAGNASNVAFPGFFGTEGFPTSLAFTDSNSTRLNGVIGGGQIGYNYQFSPTWVLGFEADIQGSGERGSSTSANPFSTTFCSDARAQGPPLMVSCGFSGPLNGTATTAYDARIDWFGTVRARLGYLVTDQLLLYGTGGLAYGGVKLSGFTNVTGTAVTIRGTSDLTPGTTEFSDSRTNVGWTAGAGIEGRFAYLLPAGWTWKLEYLYVDLGSLDSAGPFGFSVPNPPNLPIFTSPFTGTMTTHTHFTDNIVRVGLNYQFH